MSTTTVTINTVQQVGQMLYVDQTYGSDSGPTIGLRNRFDRPFLTPTAAKAAAMAGDIIHVGPGDYDDINLLKDGVNWYFEPGATISSSAAGLGSIFDNTSNGVTGPITCTISGFGNFHREVIEVGLNLVCGVIVSEDPDTNITLNANFISSDSTGANTWTVHGRDGHLKINANEINGTNAVYNIGWENGTMHVNANTIRSESYAIHSFDGDGTEEHCYVTAHDIIAPNASLIVSSNTGAEKRVWVTCEKAVGSILQDSGLVYLTCQKLTGVYQIQGGQFYLTAQKVVSSETEIFGGTLWLDIGEMTTSGYWANDGADINMKVAKWTPSTDGLVQLSGSTIISALIDTSSNATSNPIVMSGGTLTMNSCTLIPEATRNAVEAATAQTVISNGSTSEFDSHANVTFEGDFFYNDGTDADGNVATKNANGSWSWAASTGGGGGAPAGDGIVSVTGGVFDTPSTLGDRINASTAKTTPVDADMIGLMDSAASNVLKKLSWANIKATLKTYFDTLYSPTALTIRTYSGTTDTLVLTDAGNWVRSGNAAANIMTIPTNATVAFPIGTQIAGNQYGAGQMSIAPDGGVTLNSSGGARKLVMQYSPYLLTKTGTNEWHLTGEITT